MSQLCRLLCVLFITIAGIAGAHDLRFGNVDVLLDPETGTYRMALRYDIDALLADTDPYHMTNAEFDILEKMPRDEMDRNLELIREDLDGSVSLLFDGRRALPEILFPEYADGMPARPIGGPTFEKHTREVIFTGTIPEGAKSFEIVTEELGNCTVVIRQAGIEGEVRQVLAANDRSPAVALGEAITPPTVGAVIWQFGYLGFEHIFPEGLDHILFVLGLFLLAAKFKPLFVQITAFTIAHSVTLLLSIYDMVSIPAPIVEAIVALSIAYVAIENMVTKELHWWRPIVVFVFGLLHGLGFAGGLKEIGLPEGQFLTALFSFNVGVELGHLFVVGLAFLAVGWFREKSWYRPYVVYPISGIIALIALTWSIQRFWGLAVGE